jgi:hypothetical protein
MKINRPKLKQQKSWEVISLNPFVQESKEMKHFLSSRSLNDNQGKKKKRQWDIKNMDYSKKKEEDQNPIVKGETG